MLSLIHIFQSRCFERTIHELFKRSQRFGNIAVFVVSNSSGMHHVVTFIIELYIADIRREELSASVLSIFPYLLNGHIPVSYTHLYTAEKLGVKPEECLVIEDSTIGITAASRAGMKIAAVIDDRFGFDRSLADFEIENLGEVLECLKKLEESH